MSQINIHSVSYTHLEAIVDRVKLMVERDKNRFCIVMWSMGNESPIPGALDAVLEWDVKIVSLPPTAHLQTRASHKLVLPSGHPRPTVVQMLPKAEVRQNTKEGFA